MIVGYTTGVFDLFHIGHLNLLRNAKGMCDYLIVGVSVDEILTYKKRKPIIPFDERIEIVRNIYCVDVALPHDNLDKLVDWEKLKFDILFVGDDWYQSEMWLDYETKLKEVGVRIMYFPYTKGTSSTKISGILNKYQLLDAGE